MERNWADSKAVRSESSTVARWVDMLDFHWDLLRVDTTASKWAAKKAGWLVSAQDALMAKLWVGPKAVHSAGYWADSTAQPRVR
jgi:predicted trehalose synthase